MSHEHGHLIRTDGKVPVPPPLSRHAWMKDPGEKPGIWANPRNVERLLRVFYVICVVLVLLDLLIDRHVYHPWERIPGFHAWYGFASCWMLVVIAKQMRRALMRPEDYYEPVQDPPGSVTPVYGPVPAADPPDGDDTDERARGAGSGDPGDGHGPGGDHA